MSLALIDLKRFQIEPLASQAALSKKRMTVRTCIARTSRLFARYLFAYRELISIFDVNHVADAP